MEHLRFKSVLVWPGVAPADALRTASRIAARMRSRLKIVDVVEEPPAYLRIMAPQYPEIDRIARTAKLDQLESWAKPVRRRGIHVGTELLTGDPAIEIVREVLRSGHDLVIVSAEHGPHNACGTAAMRLLRKCPCPVWIARPAKSRRRVRILAAVDTIPNDAQRASLNAKIVESAAAIADAIGGAELHVLHAWAAYGESLLRHSVYGVDQRQVRKYVANTKLEHGSELEALLKTCGMNLPENRIHLLKGDSRMILPEFCKSKRIDLLVMGTVARTGVSAALMGNTAEVVVNKVGCSIMAIKPESFVCPLRAEAKRELPLAG